MIATDVDPRSLRGINHMGRCAMAKVSEPPVGNRDRDLALENPARCSVFCVRSLNVI